MIRIFEAKNIKGEGRGEGVTRFARLCKGKVSLVDDLIYKYIICSLLNEACERRASKYTDLPLNRYIFIDLKENQLW